MEGDCLVEACVLASTREQWSVAGVAMVFGWKADGMLTLTGGTYLHFMNLHGGEGVGERVTFTHASVLCWILLLRFWSVLRTRWDG